MFGTVILNPVPGDLPVSGLLILISITVIIIIITIITISHHQQLTLCTRSLGSRSCTLEGGNTVNTARLSLDWLVHAEEVYVLDWLNHQQGLSLCHPLISQMSFSKIDSSPCSFITAASS